MIKNSIAERRRSIRAERILNIRHRLYRRGEKTFNGPAYISFTQNMSHNGILFHSSAPYQVGDVVEVEVVLSGVLDIFRGYGKVVRVDKRPSRPVYSVAIQLIDFKKKSRPSNQQSKSLSPKRNFSIKKIGKR